DEIQEIGVSVSGGILTGGTLTFTFDGDTTVALPDGFGTTVQQALEALTTIGAGNVSVTQTVNSSTEQRWRVTFIGDLAGTPVPQITTDVSGITVSGGTKSAIE